MAINKKSLENLKKRKSFPKAPQGLDKEKSDGQIQSRKEFNVNCTLRTFTENYNAIPTAFDSAIEQAKKGKPESLIKLIQLAKEPEAQNINLNGGVEVQKVFIDDATKKAAKKHIKEFIDSN